jgi:hypothetical protein
MLMVPFAPLTATRLESIVRGACGAQLCHAFITPVAALVDRPDQTTLKTMTLATFFNRTVKLVAMPKLPPPPPRQAQYKSVF